MRNTLETVSRRVIEVMEKKAPWLHNLVKATFLPSKELEPNHDQREKKAGLTSSHERLTNEENELKRLFFLTFKYALGVQSAQKLMFEYIFTHEPTFASQVFEVHQGGTIPDFILKQDVPEKHKTLTEERRLQELRERWDDCVNQRETLIDAVKTPDEYKAFLRKLCRHLEAGEEKALRKGSYIPGPDPATSWFRECGLHKLPTGHPLLDQMYAELVPIFKERYEEKLQNNLDLANNPKTPIKMIAALYIVELWEEKHPEQAFW